MTEEGCGTCNGVNYTYTATSTSWFGDCKCKIHRYFLSPGTKEFNTEDISVAGRKWQLIFSHNKDGLFGISLLLVGNSSVRVQYSVTVLNSADPEKNIENCGGSVECHPNTAWGNSEVCSIAEIRGRGNGYITEDVFTVYLKIRLKIPENEQFRATSDGLSYTATWKLRHAYQSSPTELASDDFGVADTNWYLTLHPEDKHCNGRYAGIYLHSLNEFPVHIAVRLTIVNHHAGRKSILSDLEHLYKKPSGYGWHQLLETKTLQDPALGFLDKGWVTIIAEIKRLDAVSQPPARVQREQVQAPEVPQTPEKKERCVVCLQRDQTSGFVHGTTSHKCVCETCCQKLFQKKFRCPVCAAKVDSIILNYF